MGNGASIKRKCAATVHGAVSAGVRARGEGMGAEGGWVVWGNDTQGAARTGERDRVRGRV